MAKRIDQHGRRWRVRWQEGGTPKSSTFLSLTEAEAFADAVDSQLSHARALQQQRRAALYTVADVVEAYYERRKRRLQASTQHHYEQIIGKHIVPKIGSLSAREIADDPTPLHDFYDALPPTTALHAHQILRPAFQYAVDHRRLDRNPCSIARPPRKRRPEKLIPHPDEVQKIVIAAFERGPAFGLWVWLVSRLGLRRGEACALRWEDFDFERCLVRLRRTIARRRGGTYIKAPKSGEARTLQMNPRFFEKLEPYGKPSGWLFPRAYNCPYAAADGISPQSTAGRLLALLDERGGALTSADGRAGVAAARLLGLGLQSAAPMLRRLEREGYIDRDSNASRVFAIRVTPKGRDAIRAWDGTTDDGPPIFPTTADEWFRELMRDLDMPYTPHCLRHFVATHLYNRKRDWVQLARFLGHSNPAITMGLYANHVVESSQLELAEAAMDLYDDLDVDPAPT